MKKFLFERESFRPFESEIPDFPAIRTPKRDDEFHDVAQKVEKMVNAGILVNTGILEHSNLMEPDVF